MQTFLIPALKDNYIHLIRQENPGFCTVVDPATAEPVKTFLQSRGWSLDLILNTHHHPDHVGGNKELKGSYGCPAWGPAPAPGHPGISGLDRHLSEGQMLSIGNKLCLVIEVPGHTLDHIALYFPEQKWLFVGDTLFSVGCGRLFEGTAEQMWSSLNKLLPLPSETQIYSAHEYTLQNIEFALSLEPDNENLRQWQAQARELRQEGLPTLPTNLGREKLCNPFLRPHSPTLRQSLGLSAKASDLEVFTATRQAKDQF